MAWSNDLKFWNAFSFDSEIDSHIAIGNGNGNESGSRNEIGGDHDDSDLVWRDLRLHSHLHSPYLYFWTF